MKSLLNYLNRHKYFFLFLFAFSWVFTLKNKIAYSFASAGRELVFHFDTPFWIFLNACVIFFLIHFFIRKRNLNKSKQSLSQKYGISFSLGLFSYLVFTQVFGLSIGLIFGTLEQNYSSNLQVGVNLMNQLIDFLIFGGFSLAYLYFQENQRILERLNAYDASLSRSKIQQLKSQLNPHFLFNNLNILDQLIGEDQNKASDFLSQFADLYRYALNSSHKELIPLSEELAFAENFFEMMEHKYQDCYRLEIDEALSNSEILVPPFCLQVLVENAVVHNMGTKEQAVEIKIQEANGIKVWNTKLSFASRKKGNGVALKNLTEQFELLTGTPISIKELIARKLT